MNQDSINQGSMNQERYRAWRFSHPDVSSGGDFTGLQIAPTGTIDMVSDAASVHQAILLLLSTQPGERVMRPHYGCELHRLLFSPNDNTTAGLAIYYVRQAIERWEPRVDIVHLDAGRNPDHPAQLDVMLIYRLKGTQPHHYLTLAVNLAGE